MKTHLLFLIIASLSFIACVNDDSTDINMDELNTVDKDLIVNTISELRKQTVKWNPTLEEASAIQTLHMCETGEVEHTWSDGTCLYKRLKAVGYDNSYAGECLAWGISNEVDVINAWMNSDGHRRTILDPQYNTIGVTQKDNYWTLVMGYK